MAVQKGKQGTKGKKQILEENKSTLKFYAIVAVAATALHLFGNYLFFWDEISMFYWTLIIFAVLVLIGCHQFMTYMARPAYSETGQLMDGGVDLNMESGIAEHVKDLIILTSGCQVFSLISAYFWFLWLLAPGRAFYLLWVNILGPWFFQPPPEVDEKKQKKMERRAQKRF